MTEKKYLYLGLNPKRLYPLPILHQPLIETQAVPFLKFSSFLQEEHFKKYTHLLFTSQTAVHYFFLFFQKALLSFSLLQEKKIIAIGPATQKLLLSLGCLVQKPTVFSQEGLIPFLEKTPFSEASFFWPRSNLSRPLLSEYIQKKGGKLDDPILYEINYLSFTEEIVWEDLLGVIFTSPSTVEGFRRAKLIRFSYPPFYVEGLPTLRALKQAFPSCEKIEKLDTLLNQIAQKGESHVSSSQIKISVARSSL